MGSRAEFFEAVRFVEKHKIRPVVDTVLDSLEKAEDGFQLMKRGGQFGKVSTSAATLRSFVEYSCTDVECCRLSSPLSGSRRGSSEVTKQRDFARRPEIERWNK